MSSKSEIIAIMIYGKANEVVGELFESLLNKYQNGSETSMKGSYFMLIV